MFGAFGKSALSGHVEHSNEFFVVLLSSGSSNQFVPGMVDDGQNVSETELARVEATAASRHAHHRAHEIISGDGQQEFLFHHVLALGADVMQPYGSFQRT